MEYMKKNSLTMIFTIFTLFLLLFSSNTIIAQDQGPGSPNPPEDIPSGGEDTPGSNNPNSDPPQYNNPNENENQDTNENTDDQDTEGNQQQPGNQQQEKEGEDNKQGNETDEKGQNQHHEQNQNGQKGIDVEITEKQQRYEQRILTITRSMNQTHIRSTWEKENEEDSFEVFIDTEDTPSINMEYTTEDSSDKGVSYQIVFKDIKEFDDINGNGIYDEDDLTVGIFSLEQEKFRAMNYENMTSSNGENIQIISTGTSDNMFTAKFYATERYAYISQSLCTPHEIKMDFVINNYQFKQNNTRLALTMELRTNFETDLDTDTFDELQGYATNENQFSVRSGNKTGFFSWVDTVDVDNTREQVHSMISSEKIQTLENNTINVSTISTVSFSYPQGENITHDPKIGVISLSTESFASAELAESLAMIKMTSIYSYLIVCILAAVIFLGIIYYRKRV